MNELIEDFKKYEISQFIVVHVRNSMLKEPRIAGKSLEPFKPKQKDEISLNVMVV